jgi:hypothetical protein
MAFGIVPSGKVLIITHKKCLIAILVDTSQAGRGRLELSALAQLDF